MAEFLYCINKCLILLLLPASRAAPFGQIGSFIKNSSKETAGVFIAPLNISFDRRLSTS